MNKNYLFVLVFVLALNLGHAQSKTFYIGHSLSDQIGEMVKSMTESSSSSTFQLGYQSIPGAPLRWQWNRKNQLDYNAVPPFLYGFYDAHNGLASGKYAQLVLTESVPRQSQHEWGISETYKYADSFYVYAKKYNPNIEIFFYEVWHCIKSGRPTECSYDIDSNPWRQRLEDDLPMWESVVTYLNDKYSPDQPVCLVPVGQALARLSDEIKAGTVPGLEDNFQLFSDDIHLSDQGKYFVACVHYAVLHKKNPLGLPHQLKNIWGGNFNAPTPAQAKRYQEIAWETVVNYEGNCLGAISSTMDEKSFSIKISPNPACNIIQIQGNILGDLTTIYDNKGQEIMRTESAEINIEHLPAGLYFLKNNEAIAKFIKI